MACGKGIPTAVCVSIVLLLSRGLLSPIMQRVGFNIEEVKWFHGGPPINRIPLPVPDPSHPWGDQNCSTCKVLCSGHYLTPVECASVPCEPPSKVSSSNPVRQRLLTMKS